MNMIMRITPLLNILTIKNPFFDVIDPSSFIELHFKIHTFLEKEYPIT